MLDLVDVKDSWLYAANNFDQWKKEFEIKYEKPMLEMSMGMMMQSAPPEIIEKLKEMDPKGLEQIQKKYGGG